MCRVAHASSFVVVLATKKDVKKKDEEPLGGTPTNPLILDEDKSTQGS